MPDSHQASAHEGSPENRGAHPCAPVIPAEAQARQQLLREALEGLAAQGPSREPEPLRQLREAVAGRAATLPGGLLQHLAAGGWLEDAGELLRGLRPGKDAPAALRALQVELAPLVQRARQQRAARLHLDTRRVLVRLTYAKSEPLLPLDEGDLRSLVLEAFRWEGLALALDLGKRAHPLLTPGLPLAAGVAGEAETFDAVFRTEPQEPMDGVMERLHRRLPQGLRLHAWEFLPPYASPVVERAQEAHYAWTPSTDRLEGVRARLVAFLGAETWPWIREGKAEGHVDLRRFMLGAAWEGDCLRFRTALGVQAALSPLKALAALLAWETAEVRGLTRTSVRLGPDPRLIQADRFETKLKNLYEDAVPLSGGSNITLVEEEDDEPLRLG